MRRVSGFKDEEFSLDALRGEPSSDALEALDLGQLHHALLVEGCREQLLLSERLTDQTLEEVDAMLRSAPSDFSQPSSELPESLYGFSEDRLDHQ